MTSPLNRHLDWMRLRGLAPGTIDARKSNLNLCERRVGRPLLAITAAQLEAYQRHLSSNPGTRAVQTAHLRCFYRWAYDKHLTRDLRSRLLQQPKIPRRLPRPMAEDDLTLALTVADRRVHTMIVLAGYAGLRAVELSRMDRGDVLDFAQPPVLLVHGKGSKDRVVPLNRTCMEALRALPLPTSGPVFPRRDGLGPLSASAISTLTNGHLHDLGITSTFHQLRHRMASQLYHATRDLRLVQEVLGHANPSTTAGYAAWAAHLAADAVRLLDSTESDTSAAASA